MSRQSYSRRRHPGSGGELHGDAYVRHVLDPAAVCDGACACLGVEPDPVRARQAMADALADIGAAWLVAGTGTVGVRGAVGPAGHPDGRTAHPTVQARFSVHSRRYAPGVPAAGADDRKEAA